MNLIYLLHNTTLTSKLGNRVIYLVQDRAWPVYFGGYSKLQDNLDIHSNLKCFRWEWKF